MKNLEEALEEAVKGNDTQGAKEIIRMQSESIDYHHIFSLAARYGNADILKFLEPHIEIKDEDIEFNEEDYSGGPFLPHIERQIKDDLKEEAQKKREELIIEAWEDVYHFGHCKAALYLTGHYDEIRHTNVDIITWFEEKCGQQFLVDGYLETVTSDGCYAIDKAVTDRILHLIRMAIWKHCVKGDLTQVKFYIESCKLNIDLYQHIIFDAAHFGHLDIVKYFVARGADLSQPSAQPSKYKKQILARYLDSLLNEENDELEDDERYKDEVYSLWDGWKSSELHKQHANVTKIKDVRDYIWDLTAKHYPNLLI
jgi:hypothetical protein